MNRRRLVSLAVLALGCLVAPAAAQHAPSPNLAVIKLESLDEGLAQIERVAGALGARLARSQLLGMALAPLGISDSSFIDTGRPIVVVVPVQGMMLGTQGVVGALPVADADAALAALAESLGEGSEEDDLTSFPTPMGQTLYVQRRDGYLIAGMSPVLVRDFDLGAALALPGAPAGAVSAEIAIEPVAPFVQMGLFQAREQIVQQVVSSLPRHDDGSREEETAAQSADDPGRQLAEKAVDLYLAMFQDLINNTSRIQLVFDVAGDDLMFHVRIVPRSGSTFEEFVGAQTVGVGDLGSLARVVDPDRFVALFAGGTKATDGLVAAYEGYARQVLDLLGPNGIGSLFEAMGEEDAEESDDAFDALLEWANGALESGVWKACLSTVLAGGVAIDPSYRVSVVEAFRVADSDKCFGFVSEMIGAVKPILELSASVEEDDEVDFGIESVQYGAASGLRVATGLPEDEEVARSDVTIARAGDVFLYVSEISGSRTDGPGAFEAAVDRLAGSGSGKIGPELFAPFSDRAGVLIRLDLAGLARAVGVEEDELSHMAGRDTVVTGGLIFDGDAMGLAVACPLDVLSMIEESQSESPAPSEERAPDAPGPKPTETPATTPSGE